MTDLAAKIQSAALARQLLPNGSRLLIAVSGGLDSMVLLHLLHELSQQHQWKLAVAHFDHQLRGRASRADSAFVKRAAAKLGLPCFSDSRAVRRHALESGISIEMAARALRHQFLAQCALREGFSRIVLAHHADDQVELFFLRMLRGTGPEGLGGMKWSNRSPVDPSIILVRPLLEITKSQLAAFAAEHKIKFREDASNSSTDILRNRVRHRLLPLLKRHYQPALASTTLRLMNLMAAEDACLTAQTTGWFEAPSDFSDLAVALQRRVIHRQLLELNVPPHFEAIEWLRNNIGKPLALSKDIRVQLNDDGILSKPAISEADFQDAELVLELNPPRGNANFGSMKFRWKVLGHRADRALRAAAHAQESFDADAVGSVVVLRHWRPGDRFRPIGMGGTVKLQDWFGNRKIPQQQRHKLIIATTRTGEIFWVEGERISENFKLTSGTTRRLEWKWSRLPAEPRE